MSEPLSKTREKNLRQGNKYWREGDAEDVAQCFATIDALRDELAAAEKKATRRLDYETAFKGLRGVVNVQYNAINDLTKDRDDARLKCDDAQEKLHVETEKRFKAIDSWDKTFREMEGLAGQVLAERDEARRERDNWKESWEANGETTLSLHGQLLDAREHWERCEEGWNKVIKQAEDFQGERDDAYKLLESMTVARDSLSDRLLDTKLGEALDRIDVLEEGMTATGLSLTNDLDRLREALPAIIFGVVYYDLGEHGVTWERCVEKWAKHWEPSLREEHSGDCTDECHACIRCQAEDVMKLVDIVRRGLDDGE